MRVANKEEEESVSSNNVTKKNVVFSSIENVGDNEIPQLTVYTDYRLYHSRFRWFWQFSYYLDKLGEARGVARQPPNERTEADFWHFLRLTGIWVGATCSIPSMTGFFLGSLLFNLSFKAAVSSGVLGSFAGSLVGAYGAVMGSRSGLRAMMGVKYQYGWWFGKILAVLNCCTLLGWLIVNGNFGGQLLSALTNEHLSIQIGILILFLVVLIISVFGIRVMAVLDTFFITPLIVAFLLCYVCTGRDFDVTSHSKVEGVNLRAAWVSNFQTCIGITSTWLPVASDYHLDMPERTNRFALYLFALIVIFIPTAFVGILGCGLASAGLYNPVKSEIYKNYGGAGLIVDGMNRWHGGGKFLVVLMYISLITNGSFTTYSFGLSFQTLGRPIARIPRYILVVFGSIVWYVLTAVGQSGWAEVVANFLPMIGYWSMIYAAVLFPETLWFRRHAKDDYEWDEYLNPSHFPYMFAAMFASLCGIAGVVVGMNQYYYVGPLAKTIGSDCELGTLLAFGFTLVAYIPSRYLEIYIRNDDKIKP
nr:Tpn1 [Starmerella bombicola]